MATVTSLTADRMLAIEAASVVDGDVDASGNLILTQKGGTQINAGSVIGPPGPQGPVGSMLSVLTAQPVLDVGIINQIRAGRQLGPADFGNMGLAAPLGLWNLSDLSDASGNGRALNNKGAVTFASGINGGANTAAQFIGSTAQSLYIPDTGAADPFRIKNGTIGCWFRVAKLSATQVLISKWSAAAGNYCWWLGIAGAGSNVAYNISSDGSTVLTGISNTNVVDDKWHFAVMTIDSTALRIYVDSILEQQFSFSGTLFSGSGPLNIGTQAADASTAGSSPFFGRIDEAFVTSDVLSEEEIRNLYCSKISHTLAAVPARFTTNVRRRRRGAALVAADFPTQPLRLHNFSAASLGDEGSNNQVLTAAGSPLPASVSGADGSAGNAYQFGPNNNLYSTDTGLPSGLAARSYGAWVKCNPFAGGQFLAWGGVTGSTDARLGVNNPGNIYCYSGADGITGPFVADGLWHFVVGVEDNGALDGIKRKLYVDGKLVGASTGMNAITLAGATHFRVGVGADFQGPFVGTVDAGFVCGYALTMEQIIALYVKSSQALTPSPKNPGDHIEAADTNNIFAIFDTIDTNAQIDLKVAS